MTPRSKPKYFGFGPAYLCGVVPTVFTVAVMEKATELFDLELPGEVVNDARRDAREVLKEGTKKTGGAELDGKPQTAMVTAMRVDELAIRIVQVEVAVLPGGGVSQNLQVLRGNREYRISAVFRRISFAKVSRKS